MLRALLVDLDDTLLDNDIHRFLPTYFDGLARELAAFGPPEDLLRAILAGTQAMLGNTDPERTLAQAFYEFFERAVGVGVEAVAPAVDRFYRTTYLELESLTRPVDGAAELLRVARDRGLAVAVATNPLMIRSALERRLEWAGVPTGEFEYALISDVETFHFAKPRLAYYAEVLARLGLLPSEAVMIGNDPSDDLLPASALGLRVFQVGLAPTDGRVGGDLRAAATWLASVEPAPDAPAAQPAALVARFEGQFAATLWRLDRMSADEMRRPTNSGLTPLEIVCHLRDVDREVNLPRLTRILAEDNPFLSAIDTDAWIQERRYASEDPVQAVQGFRQARRAVLEALHSLAAEAWQRPTRHSLLGPVRLQEWVSVLAEHDLRHQAQLSATGPAPDDEVRR